MIRRTFRFGLVVGLLTGAAIAISKLLGQQSQAGPPNGDAASAPWTPAATPAPTPAPAAAPAKPAPAAAKKAAATAWVEPSGNVCPTSHPVKGKLTSKIFHIPGMLNYDRTHPDRCYLDAAKAEADGLRPAKR